MFAPGHRQIPGQPAYTGHKKKANAATGSPASSSPCHDSHHTAQQAPTGSTQSSPRTGAYSPAPSSPGSSSSAKSVRWGQSDSVEEGLISPGCYSVGSPKPHPKPVLKYRTLHVANAPSLFDEDTPKIAASVAIDTVLCDVVTCLKNFKLPSELDFTPNAASIMILAKVEKNRSFIDQFCKFERLAKRLAEIPTHGDEQLEDRHYATSAVINRALSRMKEHQTKLGIKFIRTALDELAIKVRICVQDFVYPCQLDFAEDCKDGMLLVRSERNKRFIYQLQLLSLFKGRLNNIPEYDNEKLDDKRRAVGDEIERSINRMKLHQLSLYHYQLSQQPRRI